MTQLYHWVFTQKAPSQQATDASYQCLQQRCSQQVSFGTSVVCDKCLFTKKHKVQCYTLNMLVLKVWCLVG